jgi:hypothetical protein
MAPWNSPRAPGAAASMVGAGRGRAGRGFRPGSREPARLRPPRGRKQAGTRLRRQGARGVRAQRGVRVWVGGGRRTLACTPGRTPGWRERRAPHPPPLPPLRPGAAGRTFESLPCNRTKVARQGLAVARCCACKAGAGVRATQGLECEKGEEERALPAGGAAGSQAGSGVQGSRQAPPGPGRAHRSVPAVCQHPRRCSAA